MSGGCWGLVIETWDAARRVKMEMCPWWRLSLRPLVGKRDVGEFVQVEETAKVQSRSSGMRLQMPQCVVCLV